MFQINNTALYIIVSDKPSDCWFSSVRHTSDTDASPSRYVCHATEDDLLLWFRHAIMAKPHPPNIVILVSHGIHDYETVPQPDDPPWEQKPTKFSWCHLDLTRGL